MEEPETARPNTLPARQEGARGDGERLRIWLRHARRRIVLAALLRAAARDGAWGLAGFAAALLADRLLLPGLASWGLLGGILCLSLAVSLVRTLVSAPRGPLSVAIEADRRLGTQERLSSAAFAMTLDDEGREELEDRSWHELVLRDARIAAGGVSMPEAFPLRAPRAPLPGLVAVVACVALALWMPQLDWLGVGARRAGAEEMRRVVDQELRSLDETLADLESEAERQEAKTAGDVLRRVRKAVERSPQDEAETESAKTSRGARAPKEEGFVRLSRAEEGLQEGLRNAELAGLKKTLDGLRRLDAAPGDRESPLRAKLAQGRFRDAQADLRELADSVRSLRRDPAAPPTSSDQDLLDKVGRELADLAKELSEKLPPDSELARRLAAAARSARSGTADDAAKALQLSEAELRRLADLAQQADLLDRALAAVQEKKDALAARKECPACGKPYCKDCGKPQCACKVGAKPGGT